MSAAAVTRSTQYTDLPEWMTVTETAAHMGVTTWFVYQRIHQGEMPYRRVGPKIIQIPRIFFHSDTAQLANGPSLVATAKSAASMTNVAAKPTRRLTAAKRRTLVREIAKEVLREALDRVRTIEHEEPAHAEAL